MPVKTTEGNHFGGSVLSKEPYHKVCPVAMNYHKDG